MRGLVTAVTIGIASLLVVGCSDDSDDPTTASASATNSASETSSSSSSSSSATDSSDAPLPETPLTAVLDSTYPTGGFDETAFGVAPGSVTAAWYSSGDHWAVHYDGLVPDDALGKCLGNSLQTASAFEYVSNSPYGALACAGYEENPRYTGTILPPGSLFLCGVATIVYVTQIPLTAEGTLYASVEQVRDDGIIQGMTSMVVADAAGAPAIEVDDCTVVS